MQNITLSHSWVSQKYLQEPCEWAQVDTVGQPAGWFWAKNIYGERFVGSLNYMDACEAKVEIGDIVQFHTSPDEVLVDDSRERRWRRMLSPKIIAYAT